MSICTTTGEFTANLIYKNFYNRLAKSLLGIYLFFESSKIKDIEVRCVMKAAGQKLFEISVKS